MNYGNLLPKEARLLFRQGLVRQTSGMCYGYLQLSMKMIPQKYAFDFLLFCQRLHQRYTGGRRRVPQYARGCLNPSRIARICRYHDKLTLGRIRHF